MKLIYDLASGAMVSDNLADLPENFDAATQGWREEPIGYPDRIAWSPALPGFIDIVTPALTPRYTFNQWVDLFPLAEQIAIVTATMTDPLAKLIYDRAQSASGSIDPSDPRTLEGLGYLLDKGWVTQATYDRIAAL